MLYSSKLDLKKKVDIFFFKVNNRWQNNIKESTFP